MYQSMVIFKDVVQNIKLKNFQYVNNNIIAKICLIPTQAKFMGQQITFSLFLLICTTQHCYYEKIFFYLRLHDHEKKHELHKQILTKNKSYTPTCSAVYDQF